MTPSTIVRPPAPLAAVLARLLVPLMALALAVAGLTGCGDDDDEDAKAAFCGQLTGEVQRIDDTLAESVVGADPVAGRQRLDAALSRFDRLAKSAPGDIDQEAQLVARVLRSYRDALEGADPNDPVATRNALKTIAGNRDEIEEASRKLADYASEECGVDLEGSTTTSTTPTTDPG